MANSLSEATALEIKKIFGIDKTEEVIQRFEEVNIKQSFKAVTSIIYDKLSNKGVLFSKAYKHPHNNSKVNSTEFDKEIDPYREYLGLQVFNKNCKKPIVPIAKGYVPSERRILMEILEPSQTKEEKMIELYKEIVDRRKQNDYEKLKVLKMKQDIIVNKTIDEIINFQITGNKLKNEFKDESGRFYYAAQRPKEEMIDRMHAYINHIKKLKREIAKEHVPNNGIEKKVVSEIIGFLWNERNSERRRYIAHRDFGLYNITIDGIIFDLCEFGQDYEEVDLIRVLRNPLYIRSEKEFKNKYFKKFFAQKWRVDIDEIKRKLRDLYSEHHKILYYNVLRESIHTLGIISRNILENKEQQKQWMDDYKGLLKEIDFIKYYFSDIIGICKHMISEPNRQQFFYSKNGALDTKAIENINTVLEFFKKVKISSDGLKKIDCYIRG